MVQNVSFCDCATDVSVGKVESGRWTLRAEHSSAPHVALQLGHPLALSTDLFAEAELTHGSLSPHAQHLQPLAQQCSATHWLNSVQRSSDVRLPAAGR
jgi:hypothetical protein